MDPKNLVLTLDPLDETPLSVLPHGAICFQYWAKWNFDFFVNNVLILSVHFWKWKSKNINNVTYHVISRCIAGIKVVNVIILMIPKLKLSCRTIILTPPWHYSTCHTNLCIAQPTELTEPVGHFVYWKSTSSPGSHPAENRTCRKDLWAAFVLRSVFYFLSFVLFDLFPMWGKENSDNINKMHIQGDVFHLPQNA